MKLTEFLLARIAEDEAEAAEMYTRESFDGAWTDEHRSRVLAECAAKRQIVDQWRYFDAGRQPYHADVADGILSTIRALAAVYETHPDYRAEWSLT